jgi:hypothetical protein
MKYSILPLTLGVILAVFVAAPLGAQIATMPAACPQARNSNAWSAQFVGLPRTFVFHIALEDVDGHPIPTPAATWTVKHPALGAIDQTGRFTPKKPGFTYVQVRTGQFVMLWCLEIFAKKPVAPASLLLKKGAA